MVSVFEGAKRAKMEGKAIRAFSVGPRHGGGRSSTVDPDGGFFPLVSFPCPISKSMHSGENQPCTFSVLALFIFFLFFMARGCIIALRTLKNKLNIKQWWDGW